MTPTIPPLEPLTSAWSERVRQADTEAEEAFAKIRERIDGRTSLQARALIAIAAELRAQRIARRPGGGA